MWMFKEASTEGKQCSPVLSGHLKSNQSAKQDIVSQSQCDVCCSVPHAATRQIPSCGWEAFQRRHCRLILHRYLPNVSGWRKRHRTLSLSDPSEWTVNDAATKPSELFKRSPAQTHTTLTSQSPDVYWMQRPTQSKCHKLFLTFPFNPLV